MEIEENNKNQYTLINETTKVKKQLMKSPMTALAKKLKQGKFYPRGTIIYFDDKEQKYNIIDNDTASKLGN